MAAAAWVSPPATAGRVRAARCHHHERRDHHPHPVCTQHAHRRGGACACAPLRAGGVAPRAPHQRRTTSAAPLVRPVPVSRRDAGAPSDSARSITVHKQNTPHAGDPPSRVDEDDGEHDIRCIAARGRRRRGVRPLAPAARPRARERERERARARERESRARESRESARESENDSRPRKSRSLALSSRPWDRRRRSPGAGRTRRRRRRSRRA